MGASIEWLTDEGNGDRGYAWMRAEVGTVAIGKCERVDSYQYGDYLLLAPAVLGQVGDKSLLSWAMTPASFVGGVTPSPHGVAIPVRATLERLVDAEKIIGRYIMVYMYDQKTSKSGQNMILHQLAIADSERAIMAAKTVRDCSTSSGPVAPDVPTDDDLPY